MLQAPLRTVDLLTVSALIQYQLSGSAIDWTSIQHIILPGLRLSHRDSLVFTNTLRFIVEAYAGKHRKLGPLAVIHTLRTAYILARSCERVEVLDLLLCILHDKDEDLLLEKTTAVRHQSMTLRYDELLSLLDTSEREYLNFGINALARNTSESYHRYIKRVFLASNELHVLARVKLADRIDNTLDLRLDTLADISHQEFTTLLFELLFLGEADRLQQLDDHPVERELNGALRLYELSKNIELLSVLRQSREKLGICTQALEKSLILASRSEAENMVVHLLQFHVRDHRQASLCIREIMDRGQDAAAVLQFLTAAEAGCYRDYFYHATKNARLKKLCQLYSTKTEMLRVAMMMIVIFTTFLKDTSAQIFFEDTTA